MFKASISPLLSASDGSPANAYLNSGLAKLKDRNFELYQILFKFQTSLVAIDEILRRSQSIEQEILIYDGNGQVVSSITATDANFNAKVSINGTKVLGPQQTRPTAPGGFPIGGTAGATYTATEQGLINTLISQSNALKLYIDAVVAVLTAHGLTT